MDWKRNAWGYSQAYWIADKWAWVDPQKDINSLKIQKDAGWLSDEMYCESVGIDRDALYDTLADEAQIKKERGIVSTDTQQTQNSGKEADNADDKNITDDTATPE